MTYMPTKAMILAAGRGSRLKPLTDTLPKPLVPVQGKPLIEHHLCHLKKAGVNEVIINLAHLSDKIKDTLKDGKQFGLTIHYSEEEPPGLETGGGIVRALPLLGDEPFWVINGDVYSDYAFTHANLDKDKKAHVVLVPNPKHNPSGDFSVANGILGKAALKETFTFSGIALYHPSLFKDLKVDRFSVTPILRQAANDNLVSAEVFSGTWHDVGTLERLKEANSDFSH